MSSPGSPQYKTEVVRYIPWRRYLSWGGMVSLLICVMLLAYYFGGISSQTWRKSLETKNIEQQALIERIQTDFATLRRQHSALALEVELGTRANEQLRQTLVSVERDRADLEEQIAFYKGLMDPAMDGELSLRGVSITEDMLTDNYIINGVVQQLTLNHALVTGQISISVKGVQTQFDKTGKTIESALELSGKDLGDSNGIQKIRFKYFQSFSIDIVLPEDFQAKTLLLKVASNGNKSAEFNAEFDWEKITN